MNRRNFLAGLLATTAAVPLAPAFAADMGAEPVVALDLASGPDRTAIALFRQEIIANFQQPAAIKSWVTRSPILGPVWFDEACFISDHAWEYLTGVKLDAALDAQARGLDWRHTARLREILDANPVPADSKLLWPTVDDVI